MLSESQKNTLLNLTKQIIQQKNICIYKYGAKLEEAPYYVDCSSFAQYLYQQISINIPRSTIQQALDKNSTIISNEQLETGDLIFIRDNKRNYYYNPKLNTNIFLKLINKLLIKFFNVFHFYPTNLKFIGHIMIYLKNNEVIEATKKFNIRIRKINEDDKIVVIKRY
ncbi:MAG: C40 family peptidase [Minisyncoccia bacterium]